MIETANYYFFFIVIFQKHILSHIFFPFFYIVSMLVKKTKFPVVPVLDVHDIVVESHNLHCESVSQLVERSDGIKFKCPKVEYGESFENNVVMVKGYKDK